MEFADLIRISRVDNVRVRRPGAGAGAGAGAGCEATVAVTGHHLILSLEDSKEEAGAEDRMEREVRDCSEYYVPRIFIGTDSWAGVAAAPAAAVGRPGPRHCGQVRHRHAAIQGPQNLPPGHHRGGEGEL